MAEVRRPRRGPGFAALALLTVPLETAGTAAVDSTEYISIRGVSPGIERIGTLGHARATHTASVLPSGLVLVAGGLGDGGAALASAELVDPETGAVREIPPMGAARAGHTATVLRDGRVVIAGGYNGQYLASVEVYDPERGTFELLGTLVEGRSGQTATLLTDGRILFVGGVGRGWTFLASAEVLDPATGRSARTGSMAVARESHTATQLADGSVLIVGGHRGRRTAMEVYASAEIYDPESGRFLPTGTMGTPRHKHDAVRLADGDVLVLGGADRTDRRYFASTEVYDPDVGTFSAGPSMANPRYKIAGTVVLLDGADVLVTGGAKGAELLDHATLTFRSVEGRFPDAYHFATASLVARGAVIVIGGYARANQSTAGIWRFHRDTHVPGSHGGAGGA